MMEFVVIAEAKADAKIARALADRVIVELGPDWLDTYYLKQLRKWTGLEANTVFTKWKRIPSLARETHPQRLRYLGHSDYGKSNNFDYPSARKAILLAFQFMKERPIRALLLIRDADKRFEERKVGMERARNEPMPAPDNLEIIIGIAHPMREAWVLNGFEVESDDEKKVFSELRRDLGYNPFEQAEDLRASSKTAKHSSKRVLAELCQGDYDREKQCWESTQLDILKQRGVNTGLADYLAELEGLIPLFTEQAT